MGRFVSIFVGLVLLLLKEQNFRKSMRRVRNVGFRVFLYGGSVGSGFRFVITYGSEMGSLFLLFVSAT